MNWGSGKIAKVAGGEILAEALAVSGRKKIFVERVFQKLAYTLMKDFLFIFLFLLLTTF